MVLASSQALWYLTRATGLVSLVLLTLSVVLGITQAVRWVHPRWPKFLTAGLHKNVSLLVTAFLAVHIVTAVADPFAPIRWLDVIVPFTSRYRPIWIGFGAVAVDLIAALVITSVFRRRIGRRVWRAVHWSAYACWPVALLHGLGTGSDTRVGWSLALQMGSLALVGAALTWRLATGWDSHDSSRRVIGAIWSGVVGVVIIGFTLIGPLRPGWARRAGTPTSLLASSRAAAAADTPSAPTIVPTPTTSTTVDRAMTPAAPATTSKPITTANATTSALTVPFSSSLDGTVSQTDNDASGETTVTITAALRGNQPASLRVVLTGQALDDGGVAMRASSATLGPVSDPSLYRGQISSLAGSRLRLTLQRPGGGRIDVSVLLHIDRHSGAVTGVASATQPSATK